MEKRQVAWTTEDNKTGGVEEVEAEAEEASKTLVTLKRVTVETGEAGPTTGKGEAGEISEEEEVEAVETEVTVGTVREEKIGAVIIILGATKVEITIIIRMMTIGRRKTETLVAVVAGIVPGEEGEEDSGEEEEEEITSGKDEVEGEISRGEGVEVIIEEEEDEESQVEGIENMTIMMDK